MANTRLVVTCAAIAECRPNLIARRPYAAPVIAAAIGRSCSSVNSSTVQRNADGSKRDSGTDRISRAISHLYRKDLKNTSSTGAITKALPMSFAIVNGQPHTEGSYGDGVGGVGSENGHAGRAVHSRYTTIPVSMPIESPRRVHKASLRFSHRPMDRRESAVHATPTANVAAERIAYDRAVDGKVSISPIHAAKGRMYGNDVFQSLFTRRIIPF